MGLLIKSSVIIVISVNKQKNQVSLDLYNITFDIVYNKCASF